MSLVVLAAIGWTSQEVLIDGVAFVATQNVAEQMGMTRGRLSNTLHLFISTC